MSLMTEKLKAMTDIHQAPPISRKLLAAVMTNNLSMASQILEGEGGTWVNIPDEAYNARPLEVACERCYPEMVELLLDYGADVELLSTLHASAPLLKPLLITLRQSSHYPGRTETVRVLVEKGGCDVNVASPGGGKTALQTACGTAEIVAILVEAGALVDCVDAMRRTTIHYAVMARDVASLEILIQAGANLEVPNCRGDFPLHRAARDGHIPSLLRLLKAGCNPDIPNTLRPYDTPLYSACVNGHIKVIKVLLENSADPKPAALFHLYSNNYDLDTLLMTVRFGAEPTQETIQLALSKGWFEAAKLLILAGCDLTNDLENNLRGLSSNSNPELAEFLEWYSYMPKGISTLKRLCRKYIRSLLLANIKERGNLLKQILSLGVPKVITDYLCFEDL